MKYKTFDKSIKDFAVASIHIYNMSHTPFNRGLVSAQVSNPYEKFKIVQEAIKTFLKFDPGVLLDKFIIVNSGTDCSMTKKYYDSLNNTITSYGAKIEVLDAPDNLYPGPYGARMAVYRKYPDYKYYFDCDNDCIPLKNGWYKDGLNILEEDTQIGLVGANISEQPYQCKNNIKWLDVDGKEIDPPAFKYNSGFYTFIPGHIYKLFDKYWGTNWFAQGRDYVTSTGSQGELGFPFRIMQLGYKIADFVEDDIDTYYSYIVPDSIFESKTGIYGRDDYPTKKKICPFYHAQLKLLRPEKWKKIQKYLNNLEK